MSLDFADKVEGAHAVGGMAERIDAAQAALASQDSASGSARVGLLMETHKEQLTLRLEVEVLKAMVTADDRYFEPDLAKMLENAREAHADGLGDPGPAPRPTPGRRTPVERAPKPPVKRKSADEMLDAFKKKLKTLNQEEGEGDGG